MRRSNPATLIGRLLRSLRSLALTDCNAKSKTWKVCQNLPGLIPAPSRSLCACRFGSAKLDHHTRQVFDVPDVGDLAILYPPNIAGGYIH